MRGCWSSKEFKIIFFVETGNFSITETNTDRKYYPGELVFSDEFDSFNLETWSHDHTLGGQVFNQENFSSWCV